MLHSKGCLVWDGTSIPIRSAPTVLSSTKRNTSGETDHVQHLEEVCRMHVNQPEIVQEATNRAIETLDAD